PTEDWWVDWQRELVEDRSRNWREQQFRPTDAVEFDHESGQRLGKAESADPAGGTIIPGGWDHEHCALCWATISPYQGHEPVGVTAGREWPCRTCFQRYIEPRQHPGQPDAGAS